MIHIACNIDSNFTIHCAVTLTSLFATIVILNFVFIS